MSPGFFWSLVDPRMLILIMNTRDASHNIYACVTSWLNVQHRANATANIADVGVMLLMVLIVLVIVVPFRVV